jgi:hypothetical protein
VIRSRAIQEAELSKVDLPCLVSAIAFARTTKARNKRQAYRVFAASFADINKALRKLEAQSIAPDLSKLLAEYQRFLPVFDRREADKLPPLRGTGIDYSIKLDS